MGRQSFQGSVQTLSTLLFPFLCRSLLVHLYHPSGPILKDRNVILVLNILSIFSSKNKMSTLLTPRLFNLFNSFKYVGHSPF